MTPPPRLEPGLPLPALFELRPLDPMPATHSTPLQVGVRRLIDRQALQSARWHLLPNGQAVWSFRLRSPSAVGLRVHFNRFSVEDGSVWVVEGDAGKTKFFGPYSGKGPLGSGEFWTEILFSETIEIEYVPAESGDLQGGPPFEVVSVSHLWDLPTRARSAIAPAASSPNYSCYLDAACYPADRIAAAPSLSLGMEQPTGEITTCSGTLIRTTSGSGTPYVLTAGHCINAASTATSLVAIWNYEASACNGPAPNYASLPQQTGSTLLNYVYSSTAGGGAATQGGDYAFVLLSGLPPNSNSVFSGWDINAVATNEPALNMSHPQGLATKAAFGSRNPGGDSASAYDITFSTNGRPDEGSSGSGMFGNDASGAFPLIGVFDALQLPAGVTAETGTSCDINPGGSLETFATKFTTIYPNIQNYLNQPTVTTSAATNIGGVTATLNGNVYANGLDTQIWFQYSTNKSMAGALSTPHQDIGTATTPISANITGLSQSTTYYFQAMATNSAGASQGQVLSFATFRPPTVTTAAVAIAITASGATLSVTANPNGGDTQVYFTYGPSSGLELSTPTQDVGSGTAPQTATANIAGLSPNTTYYFHSWVQNNAGGNEGPAASFVTQLFAQQGPDEVFAAGYSVALSSDGATALVGGPSNSSSVPGVALVYTRSGGVWSQNGSRLSVSGSSLDFGYSVALSGDGKTAMVGDPLDGTNQTGAAWVWTRSATGAWTLQGGKLAATGAVFQAFQGHSVALSGDGNTAIVGAPGGGGINGSDGPGAAFVWTRSAAGVWTQGITLAGSGAVNGFVGAGQGTSVALSSDGLTAVVGGSCDNGVNDCSNGGVGAAWVWARSVSIIVSSGNVISIPGNTWTQLGNKLVANDAVGAVSRQGASVAVSSDGSTVMVGGPGDNNSHGAAWVWARTGNAFIQQGSKLTGSNVFGESVTLSGDGNTAVVGSGPWVYQRSGGVWSRQTSQPLCPLSVSGCFAPVALSTDGSTLIVGGASGAAWAFAIAPTTSVTVTSVGNGASFTQAFAPGMLMSAFGTELSYGNAQTFSTAPLPVASASGTSVTINGIAAPLLYVSPTQINMQMPYEVKPGAAVLTVSFAGRTSSINFTVQAAAPGIFVDSSNQRLVPNESAAIGSTIGFFVTGAGLVAPSEPTGGVPPVGVTPLPGLNTVVTIGGVPVTPQYLGIPSWSVGVLQVNFTVPPNVAAGIQPVVVTIGGVSSKVATINVTAQ